MTKNPSIAIHDRVANVLRIEPVLGVGEGWDANTIRIALDSIRSMHKYTSEPGRMVALIVIPGGKTK